MLFVLIPAGVGESPYGEMDERVGPAYFPSVIAVGIIVAGVLLILISLSGREPTEVETGLPPGVIQGIGLIAAYFLLFYLVGYRIATVLSLAGFFWIFGERKPIILAIVPLVIAFGFKWIFEGIFNIRLHEGLLF